MTHNIRPFYVRALEWVAELPYLAPTELQVLCQIVSSSHEDREWFITKREIAEKTGMNPRTVNRAYARLLELDLIMETAPKTDGVFANLAQCMGRPLLPNAERLANPKRETDGAA